MAFFDLEHCRLHYRLDGPSSAPILVLSNSVGTNVSLWDAQIPAFTRHFRVLRYDARGHGESSVSSQPVTVAGLADDVRALLNYVGAQRFSFCGISLGGLTGMQLAIDDGTRLNALVLSNTAARIGTPETWNARIETIRAHGMQAVVDASMQRWFTADFRSTNRAVVDRFRSDFVKTSAEGYIACCEAIRDADLREAISAIRVPTLVIAGAEDPATTVEDARVLTETIQGSEYLQLSAAHLSNVERAQEFSGRVSAFVVEHERWGHS